MRHFIPKRGLCATLAVVLVLTASLIGSTLPAAAGVSGSGGGNLVINVVYKTVVKQDITYVNQVDVPGLVGNPLTGVDLPSDEAITSALKAVGVDPTSITITRTQVLTGTTTTHATTVSVSETPDAVVIGNPADLKADLNGTTFVVQGTVTVTDTETTIKTQHIDETVTVTGNLLSTRCAFLSVEAGIERGTHVTVLARCGGGAPVDFLQPVQLPGLHDVRLSSLIVHDALANLYGWAETRDGTHTIFELDASMGWPHGSMRLRLSTGYDSGTQRAAVLMFVARRWERW